MEAPTPRPAEEVVGALVPITLGGSEYRLRELARGKNRDWQTHLTTEVRAALNDIGPLETADEVIQVIADQAELMMDLLISYDVAGDSVLPKREWIDAHATDRECYEAIKKVTGVSFPFGADILRLVPEIRPMLLTAVSRGVAAAAIAMTTSSRSMSSARPSTAGDPSTSKPTSPIPS